MKKFDLTLQFNGNDVVITKGSLSPNPITEKYEIVTGSIQFSEEMITKSIRNAVELFIEKYVAEPEPTRPEVVFHKQRNLKDLIEELKMEPVIEDKTKE